MSKVSRVLVVLASPTFDLQRKEATVNLLCKTFAEMCQNQDMNVDFLDLYKESEFNPIWNPDQQETKALEYQIRLRKAQLVVVFHPVWLGAVPAILKGFLESVLISGFAYRTYRGLHQGLLHDKSIIVVAVAQDPNWSIQFLQGNSLRNFWERSVFDLCKFKGSFYLFGGLRQASEKTISKWQIKIENIAKRINNPEPIFELF